MTSIRSLALFNGGSCVVAVGWPVTATVTTQDLAGSYDTTKSGDLLLATTGDRYLATSGYFFMATDSDPNHRISRDLADFVGMFGSLMGLPQMWLYATAKQRESR